MALRSIQPKTILNKTKQRDPWFLDDYTLNPYSGCSFNCLYCYIRGSKYGEHMEEKLAYKENAVSLLEKQLALRARKNQYGIIVLSSATDPYLQGERELRLTRQLLEVILRHRFPVHVITKSDLVSRDYDLLHQIETCAILPPDLEMRKSRKVFLTFSFSTLDDGVGKIFEPGATPPTQRLAALTDAIRSGFQTGVSLMPLLPLIGDSDQQLNHLFATFKKVGVHYLFAASTSLFGTGPADSLTLTLRAVRQHWPERAADFERLFSSGFRIDPRYLQAFEKRVATARSLYPLPASII